LGLFALCFVVLSYLSFFSFFIQFRSFSPLISSRIIVAAYFVLLAACSITWISSLSEIFASYEWSFSGILDLESPLISHILRDLQNPKSCFVYVLDLFGLTLGFLLFVVSQNVSNFPLIFISFFFSPASLFCFQRIQSEIQIINQIQKHEKKEIKQH